MTATRTPRLTPLPSDPVPRARRGPGLGTLALVIPDASNPFFTELAQGLDTAATDAGFSLLVCHTAGTPAREDHTIRLLVDLAVDAVAVVPVGDSLPALRHLLDAHIPAVLIDRDVPGQPVDCLFCDHEAGAVQAVQHLQALGHRRIACITGGESSFPSRARLAGYQTALRAAGIPPDPALVVAGDFSESSGSVWARRLLESASAPTAIFACNDMMALGVLVAARAMGLSLPDELSVVGFDGIRMSTLTVPPLTTIEQPTREMGREAVRMVSERLTDPSLAFRRAMLATRLCVRASTASPA